MKKTNLTRSLLAACSIVALSAVMYGCSSSGEDEERSRAAIAEDMLAALAAAADLPDGTALTAEYIQEKLQDLADSQADVARLTRELGMANDEVVRLLTELATANAAIANLTQELADANAKVTRLTGELATANGNVTRLEGELATAISERDDARQSLAISEADNMRLAGELEMANTQIASLTDDLAAANAENTRLTGNLSTVTSERDDARQDLAQAREDLATARMQHTMDAATIAGLEADVTRLEGTVSDLNGTISDLQGQIAMKDSEIGDLNNTIDGLHTQIGGLSDEITTKDGQIDDLNNQITGLNDDVDDLNARITKLEDDITEKDGQISAKQEEIDDLEDDLLEAKNDINGLEDDIDELEEDIDELEGDIASKDGEIRALKAQLAAAGGEEDHFRARQVAMHLSPFNDANSDGVRNPTEIGEAHEMPLPYLTATTGVTTRTASEQILAHVRVSPDGNHVVDDDEVPDTVPQGSSGVADPTPSGYAATAAPPPLSDELATWRGRGMQQDLPGGTSNIVYAYSDIGPSTREKFKDAYGKLDVDGITRLSFLNRVPADFGDEEEALAAYDAAVAVHLRTLESDDFLMNVKPGTANYQGAPELDAAGSRAAFWDLVAETNVFPAKPGAGIDSSRDYDVNDDFRGMLDGVPGTFTCTTAAAGTECTVEHSEEDGLSSADTWQFVADDADGSSNADDYVDTMRPDGDYLVLGWWLLKPNDEEGTHDFAPFSAGRDPVNQTAAVNSPEGEARYTGPAAGKYVTRSRGSDEAEVGIFRAKAELEADFGANDAPGSISGTVSEFVGADNSSLGDWNVVLKGAAAADAAETIGAAGDFSGNVVDTASRAGGREWESGYWAGQLYGNGGDFPNSIAGTFHAMWGSANPRDDDDAMPEVGYVGVAGAFGTHYVKPSN